MEGGWFGHGQGHGQMPLVPRLGVVCPKRETVVEGGY